MAVIQLDMDIKHSFEHYFFSSQSSVFSFQLSFYVP